jgi:hypothetical protein
MYIRGFGIGKDNPSEAGQNMMGKAGDAASMATNTMNSAASGIGLL